MQRREDNLASKRRLELVSPESDRLRTESYCKEQKDLTSPQAFTGVKDFSKRNLPGGNLQPLANGLTTRNFYGNHISSPATSAYRSNHMNLAPRASDMNTTMKKPKLSPSPLFSFYTNSVAFTNPLSNSASSPKSSINQVLSLTDVETNNNSRHKGNSGPNTEYGKRSGTRGIIGFQNLGNTCFLNSPLQCLSALEPLTLDIQSAMAEYDSELSSNSLTRKLYMLMKNVRSIDVCPQIVKELLIKLRTDMNVKFAPNTQQDAHELLSELLNRVDEEVKTAMKRQAFYRSLNVSREENSGTGANETQALSHAEEVVGSAGDATAVADLTSKSTPTEANFCWSYRTCIFFQECKTEVLTPQSEQEMTLMLAFDSDTKTLQDCINKYFESTEVVMKCEKCGKDEKATITRKIVRRPRIFILTLLRYQSGNHESSKKADCICIPNYISICDYCADDVKTPPEADPIFLLDRILTSQSGMESPRPFNNSSTSLGPDNPDKIKQFTEHRTSVDNRERFTPDLINNQQETCAGNHKIFLILLDCLRYYLRFIDKYVGDSRVSRRELQALYNDAEAVLSDLSLNLLHNVDRISVGHMSERDYMMIKAYNLMKMVLNVEYVWPLTSSPFGVLQEVLNELIETSYKQMEKQEVRMNMLIKDLGLCIAAMKLQVLEPCDIKLKLMAANMKPASDRNKYAPQISPKEGKNSNRDKKSNESSPMEWLSSGAGSDDKVHIDVDTGPKVEANTHTKKDASDIVPRNIHKNYDIVAKQKATYYILDKEQGCGNATTVEMVFNKQELKDNEHTSNKSTSKMDCSDSLDIYQMFLGKELRLYTESELKKIEISSLSEDEMLVCAQALSSFAYQSEVKNQMFKSDLLDGCNYFDTPEDSCIDISSMSTGIDEEEMSEDSNGNSTVKSDILGIQPSPQLVPHVERRLNSSMPDHKVQWEDGLDSSLLCHEDLSEEDDNTKEVTCTWCPLVEGPAQVPDAFYDKPCTSCGDKGTKNRSHDVLRFGNQNVSNPKMPPENGKTADRIRHKGSPSLTSPPSGVLTSSQASPAACNFSPGNGDHLESTSSQHSSKKTCLFSPTKPNNLVKTKDYVRLRNYASPPKKRTAKGQQAKNGSVSKRLHFKEEDKNGTVRFAKKSGDGSISVVQDMLMEVNVDDMSFQENINCSSLTNSSSLCKSSYLTPLSPSQTCIGAPAPPSKYMACGPHDPSLFNHIMPGTINFRSFSAGAKDSGLPQLPSHISQLSPVKADETDLSAQSPKIRKIISCKNPPESETENIFGTKSKANRPLMTGVSESEEKENWDRDAIRVKNLQESEASKSDLSYKLVGIVDHRGRTQFTGHYTAYSFNISRQKWFHLDDSDTEAVTEEQVMERSVHTGYLFFYMDKNLFNAYQDKVNAVPFKKI